MLGKTKGHNARQHFIHWMDTKDVRQSDAAITRHLPVAISCVPMRSSTFNLMTARLGGLICRYESGKMVGESLLNLLRTFSPKGETRGDLARLHRGLATRRICISIGKTPHLGVGQSKNRKGRLEAGERLLNASKLTRDVV
jgi:hypothetical protein